MNARESTGRDVSGRDWRYRAVCAGVDPEVFFPVDTGDGAAWRAKRVCVGCPVREICLADVLGWEDPARRWGVVGGATAGERAELFARQRAHTAGLNPPVADAARVVGGVAA